jgi:DNA gyrase/topoisomerase IV subunit A
MIYEQYHDLKTKYLDAQKQFDDVLSEKEQLFAQTQPKAIITDQEKVSGHSISNPFDKYLIEKERKQIDQRIAEIQSILECREQLLRIKEQELRRSAQLYDKVYRMHFIERMNGYQIAKRLYYSKTQIYKILTIITHRLNVDNSGQNM